ncbi:hypothetical protein QYE76_001139 [Lolium multiflorum]|uniref:Retrotransposon gag domain-containing protein n=1 Tax=Lolium multiflorum TaxID=4521 RepID=A0AAD8VYA7_LOLMU|nr:hypothetical protein QYE76_001139 [Lolium multiflorum]
MDNFAVDPAPFLPGDYEVLHVDGRPQQCLYHVAGVITPRHEDLAIAAITPDFQDRYAESWSVPIFILSQKLLGAAPADEDVPPADGSTPHPLPVAAPQHQHDPPPENQGWAPWQHHVPPPQHQGVHQHDPLDGLQNHFGQNLNFIFGNAAGGLNLNELPAPAVPDINGMPDLNALPHQLHADDFLELNDLLNPVQQDAVNLQDVADDHSELTLTISSDPSSASGYQEETSIARGGQDVKMDVKLDMELDMKISHGRAREEREACARGDEEIQAGPAPVDGPTPAAGPWTGQQPPPTGGSISDHKIVNQENKDSADIINWREFEALRNEMRREFRARDDELKDMLIAIENLTAQQQQQDDDEDPELADDGHNARGAPRGHRPRGLFPLGRNGRGQDEEDGLGKPKFSIPKFEGGADVEEYLTWELKIEKLWSLHPHYSEDRKIKLASSEFDGYALRWWDSLVRNLDKDGAQPIRTWRAMKEAMTSRFVPTNYMRNIFDKLTLLRQGVKTVDEYYMEMEMLMQRGRVRESLEMTMQRFLNGLKYDVKGIVRHYTYTNMNQLLHHAREAESQLAEEAKVKGRATELGVYTPCALYSGAFDALRSLLYSA